MNFKVFGNVVKLSLSCLISELEKNTSNNAASRQINLWSPDSCRPALPNLCYIHNN